ncbi:MAG: S-methyl-5'-thioadenosine phosphorylase [Peptococcaceae bacterium]|nr:S-methyl-5'-thioadenosine phosphorylase [Peptococcaceae bacterium]
MNSIAIIGGSGVYSPELLEKPIVKTVSTKYGQTSVVTGQFLGRDIVFMQRHGQGHKTPPHMINYRANIAALAQLGVKYILATTAVGSLNPDLPPGTLVLSDQILDFTRNRPVTFFDGEERGVIHVDFTYPYCPSLRQQVLRAAGECGLPLVDGGTYVCFEGPRYETAGEIRMFRQLGGDIVGMTAMPEAILAREAEMCYVGVSMVTNFAAGITARSLSHAEVLDCMAANAVRLRVLMEKSLMIIDTLHRCTCHSAVTAEVAEQ